MSQLEITWSEDWEQEGGNATEDNGLEGIWFYTPQQNQNQLALNIHCTLSSSTNFYLVCSARFVEVYTFVGEPDAKVYSETSKGVLSSSSSTQNQTLYEHRLAMKSDVRGDGVHLRFLSLKNVEVVPEVASNIPDVGKKRICLIHLLQVKGVKGPSMASCTSAPIESSAPSGPSSSSNDGVSQRPPAPPVPASSSTDNTIQPSANNNSNNNPAALMFALQVMQSQLLSKLNTDLAAALQPLQQRLERLEGKLDAVAGMVLQNTHHQAHQHGNLRQLVLTQQTSLENLQKEIIDQFTSLQAKVETRPSFPSTTDESPVDTTIGEELTEPAAAVAADAPSNVETEEASIQVLGLKDSSADASESISAAVEPFESQESHMVKDKEKDITLTSTDSLIPPAKNTEIGEEMMAKKVPTLLGVDGKESVPDDNTETLH